MRFKNNEYEILYVDEADMELDIYHPSDKGDEYWTLDHSTMKYFEDIEEIPRPNSIKDYERLKEPFKYHSQYRQYLNQLEELIKDEIRDYLNELLFILSRTNTKNNANKKRR